MCMLGRGECVGNKKVPLHTCTCRISFKLSLRYQGIFLNTIAADSADIFRGKTTVDIEVDKCRLNFGPPMGIHMHTYMYMYMYMHAHACKRVVPGSYCNT